MTFMSLKGQKEMLCTSLKDNLNVLHAHVSGFHALKNYFLIIAVLVNFSLII